MYTKEVTNLSFSIRMTDQEQKLAHSYAKLHGISAGEEMKSAFFDMIEEEHNLNLAEIALKEFEDNPVSFRVDDARKILDL